MASNGYRIAQLAREHIVATLPTYDRGPRGIDEDGLITETTVWLEREHPDTIAADARSLLCDTVARAVKRAVQDSRPSAAAILARMASGQPSLPTFDEVSREIYRDGNGKALALIEMEKRAVFEAMIAYGKLGAEIDAKRARLAALYAEMERRGFNDRDTVRRLYEAAS